MDEDASLGARGGEDAPSTSAGAHDQQQQQQPYSGGGGYGDEFDDTVEPTNDFELLKKARAGTGAGAPGVAPCRADECALAPHRGAAASGGALGTQHRARTARPPALSCRP